MRSMRSLLFLLLACSLSAQGKLRFIAPSQTSTKAPLRVRMERIKRWDDKTERWVFESIPSGPLEVRVWKLRPDPSSKPRKVAVDLDFHRTSSPLNEGEISDHATSTEFIGDSFEQSPMEQPDFIATLGDQVGSYDQYGKRYGVFSKKPRLDETARVYEAKEAPIDGATFMIPGQEPGRYAVEIMHGEDRACLQWIVSDLLLKIAQGGATVRFSGVDAADGKPMAGASLDVGMRVPQPDPNGPEGRLRWVEVTKSLKLDSQGHAEVVIPSRGGIWTATLKQGGASLQVNLDLSFEMYGAPSESELKRKGTQVLLYTDRPIYKPGEEVFLKLLMNSPGLDPREDLVGAYSILEPHQSDWERPFRRQGSIPGPLSTEQLRSLGVGFKIEPMSYHVSRNFGNALRGFMSLNNPDLMTFAGGLKLPETLPPGSYRVSLEGDYSRPGGQVTIEVLDYQKPRFKVAIQSPRTPPPAGKLFFEVRARAMDGSSVPKAEGEWSLFRILEPTQASWFDDRPRVELKESRPLTLDADGSGLIELDETQVNPRFRYRLLVKITDAGGQRQMASRSLGSENGGLRILVDRAFAIPDESLQVKVGSDEPLNQIRLSAHLAEGKEGNFWDSQSGIKPGRKVADLHANGDKLRLPAGAYLLVAEGVLATGIEVRTERFLLVGEEGSTLPPTRILRASLDRENYQLGERARLLVLLPKPGLTLNWDVEGDGRTLASARRIKGTVANIEIPLGEKEYPNGWITLSVASEGRYMSRVIPFGFGKERERLGISVKPSQPTSLPGQEASLQVEVKEFGTGKGTTAELSLAVVDDALFSLAPEQLPDPVDVFHPDRFPAILRGQSFEGFVTDTLDRTVSVYQGQSNSGAAAAMVDASSVNTATTISRDFLDLANLVPPSLGAEKPIPKESQAWKDLRDHFLDSALWIPSFPVKGSTTISVPLGDDLTTWRATTVGFAKGAKSGVGRITIPVGKPLQVQLVVPPLLVEKDEGRALALVKNRSSVRKQGSVHLTGEGVSIEKVEKTFDLNPGQEARLSFPIRALTGVKAGKVTAMAVAGETRDGEARTLRIGPAGVETRRSGAFFLSSKETEWVFAPPVEHEGPSTYALFAVDQALERLLSPSLRYLASYPYGCVEQTLSKIVPATLIQELVVNGQMPPLEALDAEHLDYNLNEGLDKLWAMQLPDHTWGWFGPRDFQAKPSLHTTGYAIWSLGLLTKRSQAELEYRLPEARSAALRLLNGNRSASSHAWRQDEAFLLFAISETSNPTGADHRKELEPLVNAAVESVLENPKSSAASLALISLSAGTWSHPKVPELLRRLEASVQIKGNEAYWTGEHDFLGGEIPTVFALKALCRLHPESELLPKGEMHLVAQHNGDGWYSTWATAQVLGLIPDLAKVRRLRWMGGPDIQIRVEGIGEADFKTAPNPFVFEVAPGREIRLKARGEGALVWNVQGGSSKPMVSPQRGDVTLSVKRTIHRLEAPGVSSPIPMGYRRANWEQALRLNEEALLEVEVQSNRPVSYGLVEIPIPAGMEADPEMKDFILDGSPCAQPFWCRSEIHADKVAFLLDYLDRDKPTTLRVRLRARTEGRYRIRPVRFSLMGDENQWVASEGQDLMIQGPAHD